jgi:hypothetical protein
MMDSVELSDQLDQLNDEYTYRVNALVGEGREALAAAMSVQYLEDRDDLQRAAAERSRAA